MKQELDDDFTMTSEAFKTPSATKTSSHFKFSKGSKGKLTTHQNNPRPIIKRDDEYAIICEAMGGEAILKETIENFHILNNQSESRADGTIFNARLLYKLNDRFVKRIFGIGSNRLNRIKHNLDKGIPGGLNGIQVISV